MTWCPALRGEASIDMPQPRVAFARTGKVVPFQPGRPLVKPWHFPVWREREGESEEEREKRGRKQDDDICTYGFCFSG
jgi:hypothetical protein